MLKQIRKNDVKIYKSEKSTEKYTVKELSPTKAQKSVLKKNKYKKVQKCRVEKFQVQKSTEKDL